MWDLNTILPSCGLQKQQQVSFLNLAANKQVLAVAAVSAIPQADPLTRAVVPWLLPVLFSTAFWLVQFMGTAYNPGV